VEFISDNLKVIILAIVAIFATGWAIKIRIRKNNSKTSESVIQKGNSVGGDMAGRDIHKS
jgi:hypothetical protein